MSTPCTFWFTGKHASVIGKTAASVIGTYDEENDRCIIYEGSIIDSTRKLDRTFYYPNNDFTLKEGYDNEISCTSPPDNFFKGPGWDPAFGPVNMNTGEIRKTFSCDHKKK